MNRMIFSTLVIIICLLSISHHVYAEMRVKDIIVTDVTPNSFSVVWVSSEPAIPELKVFDAPDCDVVTAGISTITQPVLSGDTGISDASEDIGVMKVMVTGLRPDREYCYQTITRSKSSSEEVIYPLTPALITTQHQVIKSIIEEDERIVPFTNDLLRIPVFQPDQQSPIGALVVISVDKASSPVTGFVGDGTPPPYAIVDLNNIFDNLKRENMPLIGDEVIEIREYRGIYGCTLKRYRRLPANSMRTEIKDPDNCFMREDLNCDNIVDISDIRKEIIEYGRGDYCLNPDYDQDGDGVVDISDIMRVIRQYGVTR